VHQTSELSHYRAVAYQNEVRTRRRGAARRSVEPNKIRAVIIVIPSQRIMAMEMLI